MNVLKRFADGSYYEDFFAARLVETLVDYELAGVQLSDSFCPPPGTRAYGDFCTDMILQFIEHTGYPVPGDVQASLGDDSDAALTVRKAWLFGTHREAWIRFNARRWERFYIKLAAKLHAAGKKLMVLGMYCTDPFETLYCIGLDLKRIAAAGVDCLCPNLLPTSVYMQSDFRSYFSHRYMTIAPLTAAYMPDTPLYSMLGVQDATEEWDVLHHAPTRFERDLYSDALRRTLSELLDRDDGSPELSCAPEDAPEFTYTLIDTLSFQKVSCGFIDALACLMKAASGGLLTADSPFTAYKLKNGAYRLYLYNTRDEKYHSARVCAAHPILSASIVSRYPVLPVRYTDENEAVFDYNFDRQASGTRGFITKLAPSGVTIVDVTLGADHPLGENYPFGGNT